MAAQDRSLQRLDEFARIGSLAERCFDAVFGFSHVPLRKRNEQRLFIRKVLVAR